jgi:hypothetical protein
MARPSCFLTLLGPTKNQNLTNKKDEKTMMETKSSDRILSFVNREEKKKATGLFCGGLLSACPLLFLLNPV